ncbi:MAG: T9SS type A sorting domain-containing protein [Bacteroidia bacterium]
MKKIALLLICGFSLAAKAQQNYCDHEGIKVIHYGYASGIIDSAHANPGPDGVNGSPFCTKYIRDTALYDNIRIIPNSELIDVTPYDFNGTTTPKIRMKLYSSAPVGTSIKLQLGSKTDNNYPSGIHSEFVAVTTMRNAWQLVTFNYSGIPSGSAVPPNDIDKIVILFNPGSNSRDTIYIDDLTGPELISSGVKDEAQNLKLFQNSPNPAKETSRIGFQVFAQGPVSLKIYDIVGNLVGTLVDDDLKPGTYYFPVETTTLPNGIYFYTLQTGNKKRSMKMIVSN